MVSAGIVWREFAIELFPEKLFQFLLMVGRDKQVNNGKGVP